MTLHEATRPSPDLYLLEELLSDEDRAIRDRVRSFCDSEVLPVINDYWERGEFPFELVGKLAGLGVAGGAIKGYGCPGLSRLADGMVTAELARADGSVATFHGVHSGLAMTAIAMLGAEEQRQRWLPPMARMEKIGAFALTEPDHGSDVVSLETRARRRGDCYLLDGAKRWIGNGSTADVVVVWARDEDGDVGAFVVEPPAEGYQATVIGGKTAARAVWQADLRLRAVAVPAGNRLAQARTFADTTKVLRVGRQSVAWDALGHAVGAYEIALAYAKQRRQFGRPIAGFQLVQSKLASMLVDVTGMQLMCWRLAQLEEQGTATLAMASLAKLHAASAARRVVLQAREILGANGILLEHHVARHHVDMEAVLTYEGSPDVQTLIVGREITGHSAFAH
ncbi:MAG: acyl-CoA dehydrogenase family protein [Actinomycetota bacterium]|nr:acyl-CoA dehydrogenase family protein [Actinomycetota bacterium]